MLNTKNKYSILLRVISVLLVHAFLVSNLAFAVSDANKNTLSASSRFRDEELIRVLKDGKDKGRQVHSGKHFASSIAFAFISSEIGKDLYDNPQNGLKAHVSPENRVKALLEHIEESIDPVELAMSKAHHDPLLAGYKLEELCYNAEDNTYELPIYRKNGNSFCYKFYISKQSKDPSVITIPLGNGKRVYVETKAVNISAAFKKRNEELSRPASPLGFKLDWSTKEKGIKSILYGLSKEVPDIIERYNNLDNLDPDQIEALRNDTYKITIGYFKLW